MQSCRMLFTVAWLALMSAVCMAEEKEAMCKECNCKAVTSSLSCISNAWQTFACNISHTNTCPGNFSLYQGYFGERSQ